MKKTLLKLLSAALLCTTACTDNNYDLNDINTESRFYVNQLTVPIKLDPVKLELMLDIDDDSDIKTDALGNYYFKKQGSFTSKTVNVAEIVLEKPAVEFDGKIKVNIQLDQQTKEKMAQYAGSMTIGDLLKNKALMELIGITEETEILNIHFQNATTASEIDLTAEDIDPNVKSIETLGMEECTLAIMVKVNGVDKTLQPFAIKNLKLTLPLGLQATAAQGTSYDPKTGELVANGGKYQLPDSYVADLSLEVKGIDYKLLAEGKKVFDADAHTFNYQKACTASGDAVLKVKDLKASATYDDIVALENPNAVTYECDLGFEDDIVIDHFKGEITYSMDDIEMDPVRIGNIPEMLKEAGTNIELMNPQLYLDLNNSLYEYGIAVGSELEITGNNVIKAPMAIKAEEWTNTVMAPQERGLYHEEGYTFQQVSDLVGIVGSKEGEEFPEELYIRVIKPTVAKTALKQAFPLGEDLDAVEGTWEFYTRLALTDNAKIKYTKEWDDWGSDDLNGLTVKKATAKLTVEKDVALDAESIEFILIGNEGELRGITPLMGDARQNITLELKGGPVSEIEGAKVNVHLKGQNKDLNKEQEIKISNLKVTVDGYYDRKL